MIARKFAAVFAAIAMLSCAVSAQLVTASADSSTVYSEGFESYGTQTIFEDALNTEALVTAVINDSSHNGYLPVIAENNGKAASQTFNYQNAGGSVSCLEIVDNNTWVSSAGIKHLIDISKYKGQSGNVVVSADFTGNPAKTATECKIGISNGNPTQASDLYTNGNKVSGFTSGQITSGSYSVDISTLTADDIYFYAATSTVIRIRNIKVQFVPTTTTIPATITPYSRWYSMNTDIVSTGASTNNGGAFSGNYLKLTQSNNAATTDKWEGAMIDLSGLDICAGDQLDVSLDVSMGSTDAFRRVQVFVKGAASANALETYLKGLTDTAACPGDKIYTNYTENSIDNSGWWSSRDGHATGTVSSVTLADGEKPYLCIMVDYGTIYIDNIKVTLTKNRTEAGFAFAADQSFTSGELSKKAIKVVSTDGTATIKLSDSNVKLPNVSGEGSITIAGIVISNIPAGKSISSVSIVDVD